MARKKEKNTVSTKNRIADLEGNGSVAKDQQVGIEIPAPDSRELIVKIKGLSPLICHKWSQKAKLEIEGKQQKKAKGAREARNPKAEYEESLYRLPSKPKKYGFPARSFKQALVEACRFASGITMTFARGAMFVVPEDGDLIELHGSAPVMREDMVRVPPGPRGGADIRYRGEFRDWGCTLRIRFNGNFLSSGQLTNLVLLAGLHVGVGEWRPSAPMKSGPYGQFDVEKVEEIVLRR